MFRLFSQFARTLTILSLLTASVTAAAVFIWRDVSVTHAENADLTTALETARARVAQLAQLRQVANDLVDEHNRIVAQLSSENTIIYFLEQIEKLGARSGTEVSIATVDAGLVAPTPEASEIPVVHVEVVIEGALSPVLQTLAYVEAQPRVMWVRDVHLEIKTESATRARVFLMLPKTL